MPLLVTQSALADLPMLAVSMAPKAGHSMCPPHTRVAP